MTMRSPRSLCVGLALALCGELFGWRGAGAQTTGADGDPRQAQPLVEQRIKIPSSVPGLFGARTYNLDALLVRPATRDPLPLAVITHGTPREAADRRKMQIEGFARVARDFARRGWVAVVVMRRGHGASEGEYEEGMNCANPDYVHSGRIAIYDLDNAVRHLSARPDVDPSRVIGIGQSTGGFAWLAVSSRPPPNLRAVINFAGGHGSLRPYENCSASNMAAAMREFGKTSRIPTLWIYAENDTYVVPDLACRMYDAFVGAGGSAELKQVPPFETDGHPLFLRVEGAQVWTPLVDAFLRQHALPTWSVEATHRELLPQTGGHRDHYDRYLRASAEKAYAIALDGTYDWWWSGQTTVEEAKRKALEKCEDGVRTCRIFAVNFGVVAAP